jgi:predicted ATPase
VINALQIRNFKSLADTGKLPIKPLTFLVGPNSSGKTSIIQTLLLLRQTVESRDLKNPLSINGPYVQLGSYPDLLFMHDYKVKFEIDIDFVPSLQTWLPSSLRREGSRFDSQDRYNQINAHVEFGYNKKTMQVFLSKCQFTLLPQGQTLEICKTSGSGYQVHFSGSDIYAHDNKPIRFKGAEKFYAARILGAAGPMTSAWRYRRGVSVLSNQLAREIESLFSRVFYIGTLRESPKRIYIATGEAPQDVGLKGELSVDVLWVQARKKSTRQRLLGKVNHWMSAFGLAADVGLDRVGGNNYSVVFEDPNTHLQVNLADVGFGASQVLPIVIEGFYARDRAMLLIEQPEIHLHPRAQGVLGDLLIDIATYEGGKTVLVETHSEHLLSRIRRRIAEKSIDRNIVAIYYCEPSADGTKVREISINSQGQYEQAGLPEGFFEEGYQETLEQFKAVVSQTD